MAAYHLRRTLEHADGRAGLAFGSDTVEADDAQSAIARAEAVCRATAGAILTGAVLLDPLGRILWSFSLALAREPLCAPATS